MSNHVYLETHWVGEELQAEMADSYDQIKTMILEGVDPDNALEVWLAVYHHPNQKAQKLIDAAFENNTRASYNEAEFDLGILWSVLEAKQRQKHLQATLPPPSSSSAKPRM